MDHADIQKKCEAFLAELGIPCFIIFGWKEDQEKVSLVSSYKDMPVNAAIKGLSWALSDLANKSL